MGAKEARGRKNRSINRDIGDMREIINRYTGELMMRDEKIVEILSSYNRFWEPGQIDANSQSRLKM